MAMRAKTLLTALFFVSLVVAAIAFTQVMSQKSAATQPKDYVLAATVPLPAGTLLRAQDVTWQPVDRTEPDLIVRPAAATVEAKPGIVEETQASVYGAVLRQALVGGEPIRRSATVKPGDRDFLQVVLSPGARAIAIPVATGGASTGLLSPGDRADVILTQNFSKTEGVTIPLTRRSVSETVVENLRVLAIDAPDVKPTGIAANPANGNFGRTVTLEVTASQAEQINVATELGKLSLTLRSVTGATTLAAATPGNGADPIKPQWAGDVSPALAGAAQAKPVAVVPPTVQVFRGSKSAETVKTEN
jgi:pilus assembly protein CpaB